MFETLDKYVPDFDETGTRAQLADRTREELLDMLIFAYKEKRVLAKMADELSAKLSSIHLVP